MQDLFENIFLIFLLYTPVQKFGLCKDVFERNLSIPKATFYFIKKQQKH